MRLRIIAGFLKNRTVRITGSQADFRPTKEMVRGAMADSIRERIEGALVVDFCAGSGAFGFEMLSRGARLVHFVDNNRLLCRHILNHAQAFNVSQRCRIFCKDITTYLKNCREKYDIIYYDPPYDNSALAEVIIKILPFISADGILLFERRKQKGKSGIPVYTSGDFSVEPCYYGDTQIDIYTRM